MENRKIRNKIEVVKSTKFPDVLVVTPLLPGHRISKDTKKTIKRNRLKFFWISSQGKNNIPINYEQGLWWAEKNIKNLPKYCIMIDNDIILGRSMLDRLHKRIHNTTSSVAFTYASFEFKGVINRQFPADPFNPNRLMKSNYISSNSMFKMDVINKVGLVKDDKYRRLLDWAFLLKLVGNGYIGKEEPRARFIAMSETGSISAGDNEDYRIKHARVFEDFIKPLVEKV